MHINTEATLQVWISICVVIMLLLNMIRHFSVECVWVGSTWLVILLRLYKGIAKLCVAPLRFNGTVSHVLKLWYVLHGLKIYNYLFEM